MKNYEENQAQTFSDWGYLAIGKHFKKMSKHEQGVLEDQDPEELHQMRVGMRRLRSAMVGFNYALIFPDEINQKKVGKFASILGELRDIDVLLEALENTYKPILPDQEQEFLNIAIKSLTKKRKYVFNEVEKNLHGKNFKQLKKGFKKWLKSPHFSTIGGINIKEVLPDLLLPQISQFLLHQGWLVGVNIRDFQAIIKENLTPEAVENLLISEGEIIHDLRKVTKKVRYNLELFTHFYDQNYQEYVNKIKDIQTVLGDLQDCFVLTEFFADIFESELEKTLPTLGHKLAEIRYQKWQQWQILQQYFLNPDHRNNFREVVKINQNITLISPPILEEMG